jgi:N-acetylmuramoyl-L-alanine amidase
MPRGCLALIILSLLAPATPARAAALAIDVGHFREEPGAMSARGRPEFAFNLELAQEIAAALRKRELRVTLVGADGTMTRLIDRARAAQGTDILFSVHHDSVQPHFLETWRYEGVARPYSDRYSGFSLFVSRKNRHLAASLACASSVGAALRAVGFRPSLYHAEAIRGESKPFADRANGVHYYDNLVVLKESSSPAVLFEAGVIVNRAEETTLSIPEVRDRMAEAVAAGLGGCVGKAVDTAR